MSLADVLGMQVPQIAYATEEIVRFAAVPCCACRFAFIHTARAETELLQQCFKFEITA